MELAVGGGRRRVRAVARLLGGQEALDGRAQHLGVDHRTGGTVPHHHVAGFLVRGGRRRRRRWRRRQQRRGQRRRRVFFLFARFDQQRHLWPFVGERHYDRRLLHDVLARRGQTLFRALGVGPLSAADRRHRGRRPGGHFSEPVPGAVPGGRGRHRRGRAYVGHVHAVGPTGPEHVPTAVADSFTAAARRKAVGRLAVDALSRVAATAFGRRLQRFGRGRLQRVHYRQQVGVGAHDSGRLRRPRRRFSGGLRCAVGRQLGRTSSSRYGRSDFFAHVDVGIPPGLLEPE